VNRTNENAPGKGGVDTAETFNANHSGSRTPMQRARRCLCRAICPDEFFNADASLGIDRLTTEVESLRQQLAASRST